MKNKLKRTDYPTEPSIHSDTAITLRMYTHANEESIRRAGDTVRNLLKKES